MNVKDGLTQAMQAGALLARGRKGRVAKEAVMKLSAVVVGFGLVVLSACAQQPDAKAYQEQEKRWQSCPDGYYSGPRPGRLNYNNDKYLWVVTPEFAKPFCMPDEMVDPELKGAEAIAFKREAAEDGMDRCAVQDGTTHCVDDGVGRYTVNGQTRQLASPEIVADTNGTRSHEWRTAA